MARKKKTKQPVEKKPRGRPTKYDAAAVIDILERFADGERLRALCSEHSIALGTFLGWVTDDRDDLTDRYARAIRANALAAIEETFQIADDGTNDFMDKLNAKGVMTLVWNGDTVKRSDLRLKQRMWYCERVLSGALSAKKNSANDESATASAAAIEALERLANQKAATAKEAA